MPQLSETPHYSLQLVRTAVDGNPVLAGHQELHEHEFDMITRPIDGLLLFNFNPNDLDTKEAGIFALLSFLDELPSDQRIVFGTPGSKKSKDMIGEVVERYRKQTGIEHKLFVFEKHDDDPRLRDENYKGKVEEYIPVTSPENPRYLELSPEQEAAILKEIEAGAIVVLLDDIVSTGATMEAIEKLLEQIGVIVAKRFAVGAEKPAKLVEIDGDQLIWEAIDESEEPKLEVITAFDLPLFEGEDVTTIIERYT